MDCLDKFLSQFVDHWLKMGNCPVIRLFAIFFPKNSGNNFKKNFSKERRQYENRLMKVYIYEKLIWNPWPVALKYFLSRFCVFSLRVISYFVRSPAKRADHKWLHINFHSSSLFQRSTWSIHRVLRLRSKVAFHLFQL